MENSIDLNGANSREPDDASRVALLLSWIFPLSYLLHIAEEYWGGEGYSAYLWRIRGVHLSPARFWVAQMIGVALIVSGIVIARRLEFPNFMLVLIGSIVLINGITHTVTAITEGGYGPGLFSSLFVWIPLGLFTLVYFRNRCIKWKYWMAIGIAIAVNLVVGIITMRGARL